MGNAECTSGEENGRMFCLLACLLVLEVVQQQVVARNR